MPVKFPRRRAPWLPPIDSRSPRPSTGFSCLSWAALKHASSVCLNQLARGQRCAEPWPLELKLMPTDSDASRERRSLALVPIDADETVAWDCAHRNGDRPGQDTEEVQRLPFLHLRCTLLGLQEDVGSRELDVVGSLLELDIVTSAGAGSRWAAPAATANRYPDRIRRVVDDNSPGRRTERQRKMQGSLFTSQAHS